MKGPEQRIREIQHFGEEGGVVPGIDHAATSTFLNPRDMTKTFEGELEGCYLYGRHMNPTVNMFAQKMSALENTESAIGLASGMSAITCAVEQVVMGEASAHIVCSNTVYGGTYALFNNVLPTRGIKVSFVDINNLKEVEKAITPQTKIIYTESLSNPLLNVADIKALSLISQKNKIKLIIDNTFTPFLITPADFGADIVIHSCTKFISGASDLIAGVICSSKDFIAELIDLNTGAAMLYGPVMDPAVAYKLYIRLDHLALRIKAHSSAAVALVTKIKEAGFSEAMTYPGDQSHPMYELYKSMLNPGFGAGGMLTFNCGPREKAIKLASELQNKKFGLFAVSLGFSRTLISCPAASTSSEIPEEERLRIGLGEGLLRLSLGCVGDENYLAEEFIKACQSVLE